MSAKDNVRTVYSTATDGKCPVCGTTVNRILGKA